jgi:16S rRNA (guanine(966)-N(2))-methyltransferase RsmD
MRITGGTHRSRTLRAPGGTATRPTSDRVREALFGILAAAGLVQGARVLDLYAGTGALALEALSRGAASATLVESSRVAIAALRSNVAALAAQERVLLLAVDVERSLRRLVEAGPFDLVFADPPWSLLDSGRPANVLSSLARLGAFGANACVVLEHSSHTPPPTVEPLIRGETRRYGDTALTFYKPSILSAPPIAPGSPPPR